MTVNPDDLVIGDGHKAVPLDEDDKIRDDIGFTNVNLHRRVDPKDMEDGEIALRSYTLYIQGTDSYRTTEYIYYDSDVNPNCIP